jgi:hypothetical protein
LYVGVFALFVFMWVLGFEVGTLSGEFLKGIFAL